MNKKTIIFVIILLLLVIGASFVLFFKNSKNEVVNGNRVNSGDNVSFNINLIKTVNSSKKENYLISPYSIEIALNLLKEGANGDTYTEIANVIGERTIPNVTVNDRISVANAAFIKNEYKDYIQDSFVNAIKDKYYSEILYDDFKTPKVINDWVNKKTNGMIEKILDSVNSYFVLGLANALAVDVKWNSSFDCSNTRSQEFTKSNASKINVEMMHKTFRYSGAKYLKDDLARGIVIPYKMYDAKTGEEVISDGNNLEFVAILPNGNISDYINNLTNETFINLDNTSRMVDDNFQINLALPRFKYDYSLDNFKDILKELGIKKAFDSSLADFSKIIKTGNGIDNIYVGEAIHKTYIDLNEEGTQAAAVTYFGMFSNGAIVKEAESVDITFDKPFIYMIRDEKTKEILFFGAVYEPTKWTGSTCSN